MLRRFGFGFLCVVVVWLCVVGVSFGLSVGRGYELVSPVFKGGFGALRVEGVGSGGDSVMFYSPGVFAGAPAGAFLLDYLARRGVLGWSTVSVVPPASLVTSLNRMDVSPSLGSVLVLGQPGSAYENPLPIEDFFVHDTGLPDTVAGWGSPFGEIGTEVVSSMSEMDSDPSFCHVLLEDGAVPLLAEASGAAVGQLYELNRGCGGEAGGLALVAVNNGGKLMDRACGADAGVERYAVHGLNTFNAVSVDGGEVFFTDCLSGGTVSSSPHQLFVRLGGSRTVEVSRPLVEEGSKSKVCSEVPCEEASKRGSAEFQGASEDGSSVFFTAPLESGQAPLVPGDMDASNKLYVASIGCPGGDPECGTAERVVTGLRDASRDPNGGVGDVRGVLRVAPDGQRVYFVAGGDLLTVAQRQALETEGRAVPRVGADNLYVYDSGGGGSIQFISDLCSGSGFSGGVEDIRCPSGSVSDESLWTTNGAEAQTAGADGRFLVFATYAQLTRDDVNAAKDVYRYDASTGVLVRVSGGEDGYDANGNGGGLGSSILAGNHGNSSEGIPVRSQFEMNDRAVSEDGSRIVFLSAEPLSPMASNRLVNVYEWHENSSGGEVSLVSAGSGEQPVEDVVISSDGRSIFFDTAEGLVPQDTDGAPDVYDARIERPGEAFPEAAAERRQCEGDGCQGPLTNPAPLLVPGSVVQAPGENFSVPAASSRPVTVKHKTTPKHKPRKKKGKRARARGRASKSRIAGRG